MAEETNQAQRADIKKFKELLNLRRPLQTRFKVDRYVEDIPNILFESYKHEVLSRNREFKNDKDTLEHIKKAASWLTGDNRPGLLLYGSVGNGKTTIVRAIRTMMTILYDSAYAEQRKGIVIVSALELVEIAKSDPDRFNRLKNEELLAIDDVGVEQESVKVWGNVISPLVDLIYHRYDRMQITILTSNLGEEDFYTKYGPRVADRFSEMFDRISFQNYSYRVLK